jgi:hypothetical protein
MGTLQARDNRLTANLFPSIDEDDAPVAKKTKDADAGTALGGESRGEHA